MFLDYWTCDSVVFQQRDCITNRAVHISCYSNHWSAIIQRHSHRLHCPASIGIHCKPDTSTWYESLTVLVLPALLGEDEGFLTPPTRAVVWQMPYGNTAGAQRFNCWKWVQMHSHTLGHYIDNRFGLTEVFEGVLQWRSTAASRRSSSVNLKGLKVTDFKNECQQ